MQVNRGTTPEVKQQADEIINRLESNMVSKMEFINMVEVLNKLIDHTVKIEKAQQDMRKRTANAILSERKLLETVLSANFIVIALLLIALIIIGGN